MNKAKNFLIYSVLGGGGSIAFAYLVGNYLINAVLPKLLVGILMLMSVIIAIKDYFTDGPSSIRLQTSPTRRPEGSDVEVEKDKYSGYFFTAGVIVCGTVALALL